MLEFTIANCNCTTDEKTSHPYTLLSAAKAALVQEHLTMSSRQIWLSFDILEAAHYSCALPADMQMLCVFAPVRLLSV